MKYEITEEQMKELGKILHDIGRLEIVFMHSNGAGFLRDAGRRLYGLIQRIEMQDVEDAT